MKITRIEISIEWDDSGEFEHESYEDSIDGAIRYLKKLKKKYKDGVEEDEE
jgi:hypothetical protein